MNRDMDIDVELAKLVREATERAASKIQSEQLGELFVELRNNDK